MTAPSPYRFTVSVDEWLNRYQVWLTNEVTDSVDATWRFDTEAEAREHAALVLAALHQATLEGDTP